MSWRRAASRITVAPGATKAIRVNLWTLPKARVGSTARFGTRVVNLATGFSAMYEPYILAVKAV
jgi:hypothetical protein